MTQKSLGSGRKIVRIIVSTAEEAPFVLMNLIELESLYDLVLITEANITHDGKIKAFEFQDVYDKSISGRFSKVLYVKMDLASNRKEGQDSDDTNRLHNVALIRKGFINYFEKRSRDIFVGLEGDEVLYCSRYLRFLLFLVQAMDYIRIPLAFTLTLHQFAPYLNLYQKGIEYYGPTICNSTYLSINVDSGLKYGGKRIMNFLGCHFSWILNSADIQKKRDRYAHKAEAGPEWIRASVEELRTQLGVMEHKNPRKIRENILINSSKHSLYPRSLIEVRDFFEDDLIILAPWFWGEGS